MRGSGLTTCLAVAWLCSAPGGVADPMPGVQVHDGGSRINPATWECTPGHQILKRTVSLDGGTVRYAFQFQGCQDESHGDQHPCSEGNFGMPEPTPANWYWGGFMRILVNGTDAALYAIEDLQVLETGPRGTFQVLWAHPDAEVGLRLMLPAGSNHILGHLRWRPRPGANVETVVVELRCYPSFFTAARNRQGERHCATPRVDRKEGEPLEIVPEQDTYLYYYDAVFDVAKGEGGGPCAAMVVPGPLTGGAVYITDYPVITRLDLAPQAGEARLGLYDFTGLSNAEAEAYLKQNGARDLGELQAADFRPVCVQSLDPAAMRAEVEGLLTDADEDGATLRPRVEDLLRTLEELMTPAQQGDWRAEAALAALIRSSEDLMWKLRAFAVLNRADSP